MTMINNYLRIGGSSCVGRRTVGMEVDESHRLVFFTDKIEMQFSITLGVNVHLHWYYLRTGML